MILTSDDPFLTLPHSFCRCCGYESDSGGSFCRFCGWRDCEALEDIDGTGGANHHSLREAQHFFVRFGMCEPTNLDWACISEFPTGLTRHPNWRLFSAPFDGLPVADPLQPLIGATCPCCGYKTVNAGYHCCEICAWLYCGSQELPNRDSRFNGVSLREAQQNFMQYGAKHPDLRDGVRAPTALDVHDPLWQPVQGPADQPMPEMSDRTCPVCGYKAFQVGREICPICCWPYFVGHRDGHDESRPNPITIAVAQRNFQQIGAWKHHPLILANVRAPLATDLLDPNWQPAA